MKILITGASGFVGKRACDYFNSLGHEVSAFSRSSRNFSSEINLINGEILSKTFEQTTLLKGVDCVLHLAGKNNNSSNFKIAL